MACGSPNPDDVDPQRRRPTAWLIAGLAAAVAMFAVPAAAAQVPPLLDPSTTSTTAPPHGSGQPSGDGPSGGDLSSGSEPAPAGAEDPRGDGAPPPSSGIRVPPEAQRIIDAVQRSGPSDSGGLLARLQDLRDLGVPEEEVLRVGLGRFPIAGPARYSHDWLFPRYGPGFRFHLGTDVFAAHGTPVRAPVDGIARSANGGLGGLTVKVFMEDGTYFYLAHLSALPEGFVDGMAVRTGDIVGYVGNTGNARTTPPHLHIGIYPHGGPPIDPKPVLDQFLAEAEARVPQLVEAYRAANPGAAPPAPEEPAAAPSGAELLKASAPPLAAVPAEVLYAAGANPVRGPRALVDLALGELVAGIDWSQRAGG